MNPWFKTKVTTLSTRGIPTLIMNTRNTIRHEMRNKRRALTDAECETNSIELANRLLHTRFFRHSRHIALYIANDGEIDPLYITEAAWQSSIQTYLPVLGLRGMNRLWFLPFTETSTFTTNRFGIAEPVHRRKQRLLKPQRLDLVLMPLVAFDKQGNRLGMGGGFYDRTLAFLHARHSWRKPRLIGLAHEFQQVPQLPAATWDVPLDAVITEQRVYTFS